VSSIPFQFNTTMAVSLFRLFAYFRAQIRKMKKFFAIILTLGILVGCSTDTKKKKKRPKAKKSHVQKNKQANKKDGQKKGSASDSYWVALQKHLKINDAKLNQVKSLNATFDKSRAKLKKNGKINPADLNKWRNQKKAAMKKVLGDSLYTKKVAFDEKRATSAPKKKPAKAGKK